MVAGEDRGKDAAPGGDDTADGARTQLALAERAFEVGDLRTMRTLARALSDASDPEVAAAARGLRSRVAFDPVPAAVLLASFVFFVAIAVKYLP